MTSMFEQCPHLARTGIAKTRRRDGRWLISALHAILHNERYIGRVVWNRSVWVKDPDSGKRVRRERPRSEWIVNEGPALIDEHTWQRSQARLTERATLYTGGPGGHAAIPALGNPAVLDLSRPADCERARRARTTTAAHIGKGARCVSHEYRRASRYRRGSDSAADQRGLTVARGDRQGRAADQALHRQHRAAAAQDTPPELDRALQSRVKYYEGLIAADPECERELSAGDRATARRDLDAKRKAWLQASEMLTGEELPAERAYIDHVERMGELLSGKNVAAAREMLRQISAMCR
jgi:hypothetical protein